MCSKSTYALEYKGEAVMEKLSFYVKDFQSMHRFGDELEIAIKEIKSEIADFEVIRDAKDCIGRHWYGLRCRVNGKKTGVSLYLHIGLIYYPTTRYGLMVELDEQNNGGVYTAVLKNIKERSAFEINRAEKEYFKLFMPDEIFDEMSAKSGVVQVEMLKVFVQNSAEAMLEAASEEGFSINHQQMANALNLCNAFDRVLNEVDGEESKVSVNYADKDNFGQYASGFRYYLSDKEDKVSLYAYFGAIYSYKKQPAGIFAEIDWFSNQKDFDAVFDNIGECESYDLSIKEPKFVKLFMTEKLTEKFNEADYDGQIEILKAFLKDCNDNMIRAWKKGDK